MTKPTLKSLTEAMEKIHNLATNPILDSAETLEEIIEMADEALHPKSGPSAMELKTIEVADFILADFRLVFATNEEIGDALNAAEILSPAGKPWSRSNVAKIMAGVKDLITTRMSPESVETDESSLAEEPEQPVETPVADLAPEATEMSESAPVAAPEPVTDDVTLSDDILAELADLDKLDDLDVIAA